MDLAVHHQPVDLSGGLKYLRFSSDTFSYLSQILEFFLISQSQELKKITTT
jgi:hypothetical protein